MDRHCKIAIEFEVYTVDWAQIRQAIKHSQLIQQGEMGTGNDSFGFPQIHASVHARQQQQSSNRPDGQGRLRSAHPTPGHICWMYQAVALTRKHWYGWGGRGQRSLAKTCRNQRLE